MKKLDANWITEGLMDFEYKKYILLAYLKQACEDFSAHRLYPVLSDLIFHYNNLLIFEKNRHFTANQFPQKISKLDFKNFTVKYERLIHDEEFMEEIEHILEFAIPRLKQHIGEGREIYEFVEEQLEIFPVGIMPLDTTLGYVLLKGGMKKQTKVYEYQVTIFENAKERYRGIRMDYVNHYPYSLTNTFENIKIDLIRKHKKYSNPATFGVDSKKTFPFDETLLPVAKRILVRYISNAA